MASRSRRRGWVSRPIGFGLTLAAIVLMISSPAFGAGPVLVFRAPFTTATASAGTNGVNGYVPCNHSGIHYADPVPPVANLTTGLLAASLCATQGGTSAGDVRYTGGMGFSIPFSVNANRSYLVRADLTYAANLTHTHSGYSNITVYFSIVNAVSSGRVVFKRFYVQSTTTNVTHLLHWNGTLAAFTNYTISISVGLETYTGQYGSKTTGFASATFSGRLVSVKIY